jgi:hypothetical protein
MLCIVAEPNELVERARILYEFCSNSATPSFRGPFINICRECCDLNISFITNHWQIRLYGNARIFPLLQLYYKYILNFGARLNGEVSQAFLWMKISVDTHKKTIRKPEKLKIFFEFSYFTIILRFSYFSLQK